MKAVLFDLDGTLLDIRIDEFVSRYFGALAGTMASILPDGADVARAMEAVRSGTAEMMTAHPGRTNRDVFNDRFRSLVGIDLEAHQDELDDFYENVFPGLRGDIGPMPGAQIAVKAARAHGLRVAIATNPIFPRRAIEHRMGWAGISFDDVDHVTTYETMHACKPNPAYFIQTAANLDVNPADCLMVGDDRFLDLPAAEVGMRTFYVGDDPSALADYRGTLGDLVDLLHRLQRD